MQMCQREQRYGPLADIKLCSNSDNLHFFSQSY